MFYEDLFKELNKCHVNYMVVGGVALVLHGLVRLTADLDLMVYLEKKNLLTFIQLMDKLGYKPKVPVKATSLIDPETRKMWMDEKNMKVFAFYHPKDPIALIDVFINEPIDYMKAKKNSIKIKSGNVAIPVISIDDLIKLKELSGRAQDIADISGLEEIKKI